jgi:hypothetical protein
MAFPGKAGGDGPVFAEFAQQNAVVLVSRPNLMVALFKKLEPCCNKP